MNSEAINSENYKFYCMVCGRYLYTEMIDSIGNTYLIDDNKDYVYSYGNYLCYKCYRHYMKKYNKLQEFSTYNKLYVKIKANTKSRYIQLILTKNRNIYIAREMIKYVGYDYSSNLNRIYFALVIYYRCLGDTLEYIIPLEEIVCVNLIDLLLCNQNLYSNMLNLMFYDLTIKLPSEKYRIKHGYHGGHWLDFYDCINFREVLLDKGTFLYCDYDFFDNMCGGINSFGLSVPFFGFSIGFDRNKEKQIKRKMSKKCVAIKDALHNNPCLIEGYISILRVNTMKNYDIYYDIEKKIMDGKEWIGAVITSELLSQKKVKDIEWGLVYIKKDLLAIPLGIINMLNQKVCIYGEVINCTIYTDLGECNYFVKARCIIT